MAEFLFLLLTLVPGAVLLTCAAFYLLYRLGLLKRYGLAPIDGAAKREGKDG